MARWLELYSDGQLYELEDEQVIKVTETYGQVNALLQALRFSTATTVRLAPPDQALPEVASSRRGTQRITAEGLKLLTTFEGHSLESYDDGRGVWTIGYGHTQGVQPGMSISEAAAQQFLVEDLEQFESYVQDAVSVPLADHQFSALVCFCFNVGPGEEGLGGSTLLKRLNAGDYQAAANQFPIWNKVNGKPWLGLTRRRLAERSLFLGTPWQSFMSYEGTGEEFVKKPTNQPFTAAPPRTLKLTTPPMQGEDVRQLQAILQRAGFALTIDGFYGKQTEKAVQQFQQQKLLTVDGQVGAVTRRVLGL